MKWDWEDWLMWGMIGGFAFLFALVGFGIYSDVTAEKIHITKSEWTCTKTKNETTFILVGKILTPQNFTKCIEYKRDGEQE